MSSLEALLQKLQTQKNKIELIKIYKEVINQTKLPKEVDKALSDVQDEIKTLISEFMDKAISTLENVESLSPKQEVEVPKNKPVPPAQAAPTKNTPLDIDLSSNFSYQEKAAFALRNRDLAGKSVLFVDNEQEVTGVVVSLACPYVVIKTEDGIIKKEVLEKVTVL